MNPAPQFTSRIGKTLVVETLLKELLLGHWQGGDRVTEAEVSALCGCSRTPVREALLALDGLGIVELKRNCGAILQPLGPDQLQDLYAVRRLLEVEAARLSATRLDPARVDSLTSDFEALKASKKPDHDWKLDRDLHHAIATACGNARLAGEIARYGVLIQTVRKTVGSTLQGVHSTTVDDHLRILAQLKKRNPSAAAKAMYDHLDQAAATAVEALQQLRRRQL